eukprot:TRINITY_DN11047_c0_g1_i2.p1 TRINITY_DN11047_c0_g1~~TRINITY_DN11047_c0_g1_i2.p1  ORF type:complete len:629 (+),score=110.34 TRINITY_DN11047_c0_g1_i2:39-1889(+)
MAMQAEPEPPATWEGVGYVSLGDLFSQVAAGTIDNVDYFKDKMTISRRFQNAFGFIDANLKKLEPLCVRLAAKAPSYDIHPSCPYNGYRSIMSTIEICLFQLQEAIVTCTCKRATLFLSADSVYEKLNTLGVEMLKGFAQLVELALRLMDICPPGQHFVPITESSPAHAIYSAGRQADVACFYGSQAGFMYPPRIRNLMQVITMAMASFSDGFRSKHTGAFMRGLASAMAAMKYAVSPEEKAKRLLEQITSHDCHFVKAFWNLAESTFAQNVNKLSLPSIKVNRVLFIAQDLLLHHTPEGVLPIVPCAVGRLGELRTNGSADNKISPRYVELLEHGLRQLTMAATKSKLTEVASDVRELIAQDTTITDPERQCLYSSLYQIYNYVLKSIRQRLAATHRVGLASLPSSSASPSGADTASASSLDAASNVFPPSPSAASPRVPRSPRITARERLSSAGSIDEPLVMETEDYEAQTGGPDELGDVAVSVLTNANVGSRTSVSDDDNTEPSWSDISQPTFGVIQVRLLSYKRHEGQAKPKNSKSEPSSAETETGRHTQPPSSRLLVHIHGGGFLSNSSKVLESGSSQQCCCLLFLLEIDVYHVVTVGFSDYMTLTDVAVA